VSRRASWVVSFVALLVVAAAPVGARAAGLELFVTFQENHTITVTLADGTSVAGATLPAGSYTVHMENPYDVSGPEFDLRGPGVQIVTDMFFGETPSETYRAELQPSSTYTWRNNERPTALFTFRTSGSSSTGSSSSGSSPSSSSPTTTTKSSSSSKDVVGSAILPLRGQLAADVSTAGKLSLRLKGKTVATLKAGRYTIKVLDETARAAFVLQKLGKAPVTLSGRAYVGKRSATVTLRAGQWMFFSSAGKKSYFAVTA
jgi:flagellar hook assembly protein FlgD